VFVCSTYVVQNVVVAGRGAVKKYDCWPAAGGRQSPCCSGTSAGACSGSDGPANPRVTLGDPGADELATVSPVAVERREWCARAVALVIGRRIVQYTVV